MTTPDGKTATQPSRIIGINGSALAAAGHLAGPAAVEPDADTELLDALTSVVVRRGVHAMPVGDPLPLTLSRRAQAPSGSRRR